LVSCTKKIWQPWKAAFVDVNFRAESQPPKNVKIIHGKKRGFFCHWLLMTDTGLPDGLF
jgi:hypothetical protein